MAGSHSRCESLLWETAQLFSKVVVPFHVPSRSLWGFQFYMLIKLQSFWQACRGSHCGLNLHFPCKGPCMAPSVPQLGLGRAAHCYNRHPESTAPTTWPGLRGSLWLEPRTLGLLSLRFPTEQRSGCRYTLSQSASWRAAGKGPVLFQGPIMDGNGELWRTVRWRKEEQVRLACASQVLLK